MVSVNAFNLSRPLTLMVSALCAQQRVVKSVKMIIAPPIRVMNAWIQMQDLLMGFVSVWMGQTFLKEVVQRKFEPGRVLNDPTITPIISSFLQFYQLN